MANYKYIRYILISDTDEQKFLDSVNTEIEKGLLPSGGVCVVVENLTDGKFDPNGIPTVVYYQALSWLVDL